MRPPGSTGTRTVGSPVFSAASTPPPTASAASNSSPRFSAVIGPVLALPVIGLRPRRRRRGLRLWSSRSSPPNPTFCSAGRGWARPRPFTVAARCSFRRNPSICAGAGCSPRPCTVRVLRGYVPIIEEATRAAMARWPHRTALAGLLEPARALTLDVIVQVMFGVQRSGRGPASRRSRSTSCWRWPSPMRRRSATPPAGSARCGCGAGSRRSTGASTSRCYCP